jgi:SSS family solute:Na+ symporter
VTIPAYHAVYALLVNLVVTVGASLALGALGARRGPDETSPEDYEELGERAAPGAPAPAA